MASRVDKAWRNEFRAIKRGLREFKRWAGDEFPTAEELKLFEQCFLSGETNDDQLLLFQIWAQPNPALEDAIRMASRVSRWNCDRSGMILNGIVRTEQSPKIDILGDAAPALRDFFCPEVFVERECADGMYVARFMRELSISRCVHGLSTWLAVTSYPNPQLIWPHRIGILWQIGHDDLEEDPSKLDAFRWLINLVVHFVPPCGLPGDELPHRNVAQTLRSEFESRKAELPPQLAEAWEQAQTRADRASIWENDLYPEVELANTGEDGLIPYVAQDSEIDGSHFELAVSIFKELGVLKSAGPVRAVDAGKLLHEKMVDRLGYQTAAPVPGYTMRLEMNAEFVDSETAQIDLDLLRVFPHPANPNECDVPTMLWITRPQKPWAQCVSARSYRSLARRAFEDRAGFPLYIYSCLGDGSPKRAADIDGSVRNPGHYPLASNKIPLLDDPRFDCPPWQGEPLPPFSRGEALRSNTGAAEPTHTSSTGQTLNQSVVLQARFGQVEERDRCVRYLREDEMVFEDEVPQSERLHWQLLRDGLPAPDEVHLIGDAELRIAYAEEDDIEVGSPLADRLSESLARLGMTGGYLLQFHESGCYFWEVCLRSSRSRARPTVHAGDGYLNEGDLTEAGPGWPKAIAKAAGDESADLLSAMIATYEDARGEAS